MPARFSAVAVLLCVAISAVRAEDVWPVPEWPTADPATVDMDAAKLKAARDYALTGGGSGYITRHGRLVMSWGDPRQRYDLKSTTKSIGCTVLALAIDDQKLRLSDRVIQHHPGLVSRKEVRDQTNWINRITIQHLATHTAGFEKPGGYTKLICEPGTQWNYSDGGPNWLAECITLAYSRDVNDLLFDRVLTPLGVDHKDFTWRQNSYRDKLIQGIVRREFGSGVSANVDAMARIGYLYLREGRWNGQQIISPEFIRKARTTVPEVIGLPEVNPKQHGNASDHYGLLWWNNADGTLPEVPRDAYWSWGLHESLIVVIPSLDIVVARAGQSWSNNWAGHYDVLKPFLNPIVLSVQPTSTTPTGATPAGTTKVDPPEAKATTSTSPVIQNIRWAPASTIIRKAKGRDNWPITWADDDALYTAYRDGRGFQPFVERKLSMGLARITGTADDFQARNLRSPTGEFLGDGSKGPKASGLLMVNGTLYVLLRNTKNSQLMWSDDHGLSWTRCDWRFETSFGYPTFLNFGRNYSDARDEYVYVYSHDADSAYDRADRMVLARVPTKRIRDRHAYRFFERLNDDGEPVWTDNVARRGAVFSNPGGCYRSSVSYNAGLKRYLWCQTGPDPEPRFQGGLTILDAPEPWGPWTTAFSTKRWDVGPGETSCLPTKWMSNDGRTVHLVFSGDDCFSVRKGSIGLRE